MHGKNGMLRVFINDAPPSSLSFLLLSPLLYVPHWCFILTFLISCALSFFHPLSFSLLLFLAEGHPCHI